MDGHRFTPTLRPALIKLPGRLRLCAAEGTFERALAFLWHRHWVSTRRLRVPPRAMPPSGEFVPAARRASAATNANSWAFYVALRTAMAMADASNPPPRRGEDQEASTTTIGYDVSARTSTSEAQGQRLRGRQPRQLHRRKQPAPRHDRPSGDRASRRSGRPRRGRGEITRWGPGREPPPARGMISPAREVPAPLGQLRDADAPVAPQEGEE